MNRLLRVSATAAAGFAIFMPLQIHAATSLSCTYGNLSTCNGTVGNLTFSNFQKTGAEPGDTIAITVDSVSGDYEILSNYQGAGSPDALTGGGALVFNIAAAPGSSFNTAAFRADITQGGSPLFTFTTTLTNLISPAALVSTGNGIVSGNFDNDTTNTFATISWNQGSGMNEAYSSKLILQINSTNAVPGPLPILGLGAMFSFSRRLRHRFKSFHRA